MKEEVIMVASFLFGCEEFTVFIFGWMYFVLFDECK